MIFFTVGGCGCVLKWYFPKVILTSIALLLFIKLNSMADSFSRSSMLPMIKITLLEVRSSILMKSQMETEVQQ